MTPPSSPKGSLEELFRHHLLESEAAAVPPLPHVWEQLDNSLLLAENAKYRRRLQAYRWAMAASLLLAALAGGGWWRSQGRQATALARATADSPGAGRGAIAASRVSTQQLPQAGLTAKDGLVFPASIASSIEENSTLALTSAPVARTFGFGTSRFALAPGQGVSGRYETNSLFWQPAGAAGSKAGIQLAAAHANAPVASEADASYQAAPALVAEADTRTTADQLTARLASLELPASATSLPARLAKTATPTIAANRPARPWQLQVAYAAGMYDPNIDFTKDPASYNANLGPGTVATTRDAAAEYRHHLRPGLSQRLSVWATRRLGIGRWNLRTGLEVAQNEASSSSSVAFVGEQVPTLNALNSLVQVQSNHLQTTTYRYRSVGIPIEVSYRGALGQRFSLYGHAGTLLSALLNVRSEVAGEPEATRMYSYRSPESPYRQLMANVRGGVGMRYQPGHHQWSLNLGPVAEAGVMSLNSDPTQEFWTQHRPYSFGLEAGVEFGTLLKLAPVLAP